MSWWYTCREEDPEASEGIQVTLQQIGRWRWLAHITSGPRHYATSYAWTRQGCLNKAKRAAHKIRQRIEWDLATEHINLEDTQ